MKLSEIFRLFKTSPKRLIAPCALFTAAPALAFQPGATGLYASSQLTASVGSIAAQASSSYSYQIPSGRFSMFGVELEQTLGWSHWVSLDMFGGYGVSSGGGGLGIVTLPAKAQTYDLGATLYSSLPCTQDQRLFLEPMVGFFALKMKAKNNTSFLASEYLASDDAHWFDLRAWGPMAGLFLRMIPVQRLVLRVGGAYLMPRIWERSYPFTMEPINTHYDGARSGALASFALSYEATAALSLYVKLDYQALGASGSPTSWGDIIAPHITRSRFVWGFSFAY